MVPPADDHDCGWKVRATDLEANPAETSAKPDEVGPPKDEKKEEKDKPRQSDVRVITEAVYRANGVPGWGFVDLDRPAQIWTVGASSPNGSPETPKPIWELFEEASLTIPDEELDRLPTDLAAQVDHYVYGLPKR